MIDVATTSHLVLFGDSDALKVNGSAANGLHMSRHILVVDDDAVIRGLLADLLSGEGYAVESAGDGVEALSILERSTMPDLIVSDVVMPRLGGVGLREAVRQRNLKVPIILMSAMARPALDDGTVFVSKPFDLDALIDLVADQLGEPP